MSIVLIENFRAVFYAPFYAACALGAYEAEGLEVELKMSAELGKALQAVTAGAGQVSWGGPLINRALSAAAFGAILPTVTHADLISMTEEGPP